MKSTPSYDDEGVLLYGMEERKWKLRMPYAFPIAMIFDSG